MRKFISRVAVVAACTAGLAGLGAPAAHADHITVVPGCWGAAGTAVCEIGADVDYELGVPVYTYEWDLEVCAGTCDYYRLPFAWYNLNEVPEVDNVCLVTEDRWGSESEVCAL